MLIKWQSPGPVLFVQQRLGLNKRLFNIYKFRTMAADAEQQQIKLEQMNQADGPVFKIKNDPRITTIGKFLRKTSIDELPQLFNVLIGEMSLVGPRPHALGSTADEKYFWEISDLYWCRHALKPGITGLAQIRGFRGSTERETDLENRLQADLEYLNNWSLKREIYILLSTVKVLAHRNAY